MAERDPAFIIDRRHLVPSMLPISDCAAAIQSRPSLVRAIEKRERRKETQIWHGEERNGERPRDRVVRETGQ
jgi:hypothetical protein